jgi:hypothetical protein
MAGEPVPQPASRPAPAPEASGAWSHERFFALLEQLGRLRVISQCGASTFEALCTFGPWSLERGYMNAITPAYHWHLALARFRHLRSCDQVHGRSGRRVLFFELREQADAEPFLRIYVYRDPSAEFEPERERRFAAAHASLADGAALAAKETR